MKSCVLCVLCDYHLILYHNDAVEGCVELLFLFLLLVLGVMFLFFKQ